MRTITIVGEDRHIENIVKENRGRADRGFITIQEGTAESVAPNPEKKKVSKPGKVKAPKTVKKEVMKPDTKEAPKADTKDVNPEIK